MPRKKTSTITRRKAIKANLNNATTAELQRELARRQRAVSLLETKRDILLAKLDELEKEITQGSPASVATRGRPAPSGRRPGPKKTVSRRGRPRKKGSLVEILSEVLSNQTLSVREATVAAKKKGYKSKSANFRVIVNQALLSHRDKFVQKGRGVYTAR